MALHPVAKQSPPMGKPSQHPAAPAIIVHLIVHSGYPVIRLSGDNWATKTELSLIKRDILGDSFSVVYALSADGKIATGYSMINSTVRAIIWSGDNWATKTDLGTLRTDNLGTSFAYAISADGKIVGGSSDIEIANDNSPATIWSGDNWATKTNLGSLKSDNTGWARVNALSADGSIAGGAATNDANAMHAIIWSGNNWATKTDLGTLRSDNSGESTVSALSADGSIAVGTAATDAGNEHATVWKITYPAQSTSASDSTTNTPTPSQPSVVTVDADNTKKTLSRLGAETFSVMDLQRQGLTRLQQHCQIDAAGQSCWAVQTAISSIDRNRDKVAGIRLGHGFTETFSAGVSLDRSLSRSLPDSYLKNNGNLGAGLYAQWNTAFHGSQWYVRPAVAFNRYNVTVQRPVLENTEAGIGTSRMKGRGASLEAGQTFKSDHGVLLGWHLGGRYNNVSRAEYSEQNAAFPTTYGKASFKRTSAYLGADATIPLTTNLKWMAAAEIDRALKNRDAVYSAQADYIGSFNHRAGIKGTIATLSSGLQYTISEKILLGLTLDVNQTAFGDIARGGTFTVGGHF
nr:autotransporter domain-containing protein [Xylella fastidiosa]